MHVSTFVALFQQQMSYYYRCPFYLSMALTYKNIALVKNVDKICCFHLSL